MSNTISPPASPTATPISTPAPTVTHSTADPTLATSAANATVHRPPLPSNSGARLSYFVNHTSPMLFHPYPGLFQHLKCALSPTETATIARKAETELDELAATARSCGPDWTSLVSVPVRCKSLNAYLEALHADYTCSASRSEGSEAREDEIADLEVRAVRIVGEIMEGALKSSPGTWTEQSVDTILDELTSLYGSVKSAREGGEGGSEAVKHAKDSLKFFAEKKSLHSVAPEV